MNLLDIFLRLLLAVALGGLIGLERETSLKPAGFRTNIIVCVGSAVLMILANLLVAAHGGTGDSLVRMAAGAVTGIGFLGAGTILQSRGSVLGLTTASTLWLVAGLGLVIGAGYYLPAIIITGLVILTLVLFGKIEATFLPHGHHSFVLKTTEDSDLPARVRRLAIHNGLRLSHWIMRRDEGRRVISFTITTTEEKEHAFHDGLASLPGIEELRVD